MLTLEYKTSMSQHSIFYYSIFKIDFGLLEVIFQKLILSAAKTAHAFYLISLWRLNIWCRQMQASDMQMLILAEILNVGE